MTLSRRTFLGAAGAGGLAGLAGCTGIDGVDGIDDVRAVLNRPGPPSGSLPEAIGDAIYRPGQHVDVSHRLLEVRDLESLRSQRDANHVAEGLLRRPEAKAERGFDLDPTSVEGYAIYGPAEIFTGSFTREDVLASYRSDDWTDAGSHAGFDLFSHAEHGWYYGGGVGDGIFVTTARHREVHPLDFVRAHADAVAGRVDRYRDDADMAELLSVIGGGEYVTAITSEPDVGSTPPHTRAVGRSFDVAASSVKPTVAFVIDESAPKSPEDYAREWADVSGPAAKLTASFGSDGRTGYLAGTAPESDFGPSEGIESEFREGDPARGMQDSIDHRYTEEHGLTPPEATFVTRVLPDATETDCGTGSVVVELTYRDGPELAARRLHVGSLSVGQFHAFRGCGYELGDAVAPGDTIRIGYQSRPENPPTVFWLGPHGGRSRLNVTTA